MSDLVEYIDRPMVIDTILPYYIEYLTRYVSAVNDKCTDLLSYGYSDKCFHSFSFEFPHVEYNGYGLYGLQVPIWKYHPKDKHVEELGRQVYRHIVRNKSDPGNITRLEMWYWLIYLEVFVVRLVHALDGATTVMVKNLGFSDNPITYLENTYWEDISKFVTASKDILQQERRLDNNPLSEGEGLEKGILKSAWTPLFWELIGRLTFVTSKILLLSSNTTKAVLVGNRKNQMALRPRGKKGLLKWDELVGWVKLCEGIRIVSIPKMECFDDDVEKQMSEETRLNLISRSWWFGVRGKVVERLLTPMPKVIRYTKDILKCMPPIWLSQEPVKVITTNSKQGRLAPGLTNDSILHVSEIEYMLLDICWGLEDWLLADCKPRIYYYRSVVPSYRQYRTEYCRLLYCRGLIDKLE